MEDLLLSFGFDYCWDAYFRSNPSLVYRWCVYLCCFHCVLPLLFSFCSFTTVCLDVRFLVCVLLGTRYIFGGLYLLLDLKILSYYLSNSFPLISPSGTLVWCFLDLLTRSYMSQSLPCVLHLIFSLCCTPHNFFAYIFQFTSCLFSFG